MTTTMSCEHKLEDRARIAPRTHYCFNCGSLGHFAGTRFHPEAKALHFRPVDNINWVVPRRDHDEHSGLQLVDTPAKRGRRIADRQADGMGSEKKRRLAPIEDATRDED